MASLNPGNLLQLLDRLNQMITEDTNLSVRAFGLLLLGKKFIREDVKELSDPTELILNGGIEVPEL